MGTPGDQASQDQPKPTPESAPKRSFIPLVESVGTLFVLVGLLIVLPINNTVEYGYFDRLVGPIGMLDSVGTIAVAVLGALWYGLVWCRIDKRVYATIRGDRVLLAATIWSAVAYLWLWWLCSGCMGPTGERTAVALLGFAMPTISYYLIRSARKDLRRWRNPREAPTGSWVRRRRAVYASIAGVIAAGCLLFYFLQVRPFLRFRSLPPDAAPEEVREVCHQALWIPVGAHDVFLTLAMVGDESSVPRLISCLRWAPPPDNGMMCTWAHCLSALQAITNQNAGRTHAEWREWYAANRHKTRLEWIAEGFSVHGLPVTVEGSAGSARELLAIVGNPKGSGCGGRNARLLLGSYEQALVKTTLASVARDGSPAAKRGVALYAAEADLPEANVLLETLSADEARTVRVLAKNLLVRAQADRVANPPGSLIREFKLDLHLFRRGAVSAGNVLYAPITFDRFAAYDLTTGARLWLKSLPEGGGEATLCGEDIYFAVSDGALFRLRSSDGATVWTGPRVNPDRLHFHLAPVVSGDCVVFGGGHNQNRSGRVFTCSADDGSEISSAAGELLYAADGLVFTLDGTTVRAYRLPDLAQVASFETGRLVVGLVASDGVAVLVVSDADRDTCTTYEGRTWLEGWSVGTGARSWKSSVLGEHGVQHEKSILLGAEGTCFVSQGGAVQAVRVRDGALLWEAAPSGELYHVGRHVVLKTGRLGGLAVLDVRDGIVLAVYRQEGVAYFESVFVSGDEILAVDMDDTLHVFRLPSVGD